MPRFHEQLHKPSSPEEQELTLRVLSEEGKSLIKKFLDKKYPLEEGKVKIFICKNKDHNCKGGGVTAHKYEPTCCAKC
ncbi:MAG: hypothetical protein WED07_12700 [Candidatus Freyarchaeum deiterrae]